MAFTYTVCETRDSGISIRGRIDQQGQRWVNHSADRNYRVVTSAATPAHVTDIEVACITELPVVNTTAWYSSTAGVAMPFAVCRSKEVTRSPENAFIFDVSCTFETGEIQAEQCAATPPSALSDITPLVTATVGSYERVLYADKEGNQCWRLPGTETPFASPITETIPTLTLTVEQFEAAVTYDQLLERSFKVNEFTYRNKGPGLWMIGAVKAVEQEVQLASGSTTAVKVTYPIMLSERFYHPPGVAPNDTNKVIYGHEKVQPLVDTMHVNAEGKVVPTEKNGQVISGYINTDGTIRSSDGDNQNRPNYMRFKSQGKVNFNTFLLA